MRVDLRLQVTQLHVQLLAFQLVGDDFLLVFLALVIENHREGINGDKPDQTHQVRQDKTRNLKNIGKRLPDDEMQQADIEQYRSKRPQRDDKNRRQDEKHQPVLFQHIGYQHLIDNNHQQNHHAHKTERTGQPEKIVLVGMDGKEDNEQQDPNHAPFVEAFHQTAVGRRQSRQGPILHLQNFDCKDKTNQKISA